MGTRGIFEGKYSDDSPEEVVRKIQGQYPGVGRKMLKRSSKKSRSHSAKRKNRAVFTQTRSYCGSSRWLNSIHGRIYSVPCPQALSHIDENQFINSKAQIY